MILTIAQMKSQRGLIDNNIKAHIRFAQAAAKMEADLILFPELSLTGYEPGLAADLALTKTDERLSVFAELSRKYGLTIAISLPIAHSPLPKISLLFFEPNGSKKTYSKQKLHPDEKPYFSQGKTQLVLPISGETLVPGICYETLFKTHANNAAKLGATTYLASVAKPDANMNEAHKHYAMIAEKHNMIVAVSNAIGPSDNFLSIGRSAAWSRAGKLLASFDEGHQGLLRLDTCSQSASSHLIPQRLS